MPFREHQNPCGISITVKSIKDVMGSKSMKYQYPLQKSVEVKITQPTGEYSHENFPESKYAVDFLADVDTPVLAARDGMVWKIKNDSNKWGLDKNLANEVNFVAIDHGDDTYAEYLHLGKNRVIVEEGQKVKTGDILGYTGLSGVMDKPHLHFNVFKIDNGKSVSICVDMVNKHEKRHGK